MFLKFPAYLREVFKILTFVLKLLTPVFRRSDHRRSSCSKYADSRLPDIIIILPIGHI